MYVLTLIYTIFYLFFRFIVRRASNGKTVAVSFSFDVYDEPGESDCTQGIKYVMDFLGNKNFPMFSFKMCFSPHIFTRLLFRIC